MNSSSNMAVMTWNIAAINNNPFEYYITYDDPAYQKLMADAENFIQNPGARDVPVHAVFSDEMYIELRQRMGSKGWNLDAVDAYWNSEYRDRKIISEFLKDKSIGAKRLTSMPDRFTNTITAPDGSKWIAFMFDVDVTVTGRDGKASTKKVCDLLQPIKKAKYPAISDEEEAVSLPLQTVLLAVFDAVLVYMLNEVEDKSYGWQVIRKKLCDALCRKKSAAILEILINTYAASDVMCLQECASSFVEIARNTTLGQTHVLVSPAKSDVGRDQISVILLKKTGFKVDTVEEITELVAKNLPEKSPLADGDLLVVTVQGSCGRDFVIASFHGDTNGLATVPMIDALHRILQMSYPEHTLLFGLDANTYEQAAKDKQGAEEFVKECVDRGITTCFGDTVDPANYTTFNARTYLQPQLNKACSASDKKKGADINPKDYILFSKREGISCNKWWKDNTGKKEYQEDMVFPTLDFPSDHGVLAAELSL